MQYIPVRSRIQKHITQYHEIDDYSNIFDGEYSEPIIRTNPSPSENSSRMTVAALMNRQGSVLGHHWPQRSRPTARSVATGWTGDVHPTFPEVVPKTGANPMSFYGGRGGKGSITFGARLASLQHTENVVNLMFPLGIQNLTCFQLQGDFAPDQVTMGSVPGHRLGSAPKPPLGLAFRVRHVCPPHVFRSGDPPVFSGEGTLIIIIIVVVIIVKILKRTNSKALQSLYNNIGNSGEILRAGKWQWKKVSFKFMFKCRLYRWWRKTVPGFCRRNTKRSVADCSETCL